MNNTTKNEKKEIFRIVGKIAGEGQGYILGFIDVNDKERAIDKVIASGGNVWLESEIELIRCINKVD